MRPRDAEPVVGLDLAYLASDAMSYLGDCLEKRFTSVDAPCGGGTTQRSAGLLRAALGSAGHGAELFADGFTALTSGEPTASPYGSTCRWDGLVPSAGP